MRSVCPSLSGSNYQGRPTDGVSPHWPASSAWVYCKWSPSTSCHLEETWCNTGGKQPQVKTKCATVLMLSLTVSSDTMTIIVIQLLHLQSSLYERVQVHICRGWVFTHPLGSGDWHRTLLVHGNKSGWDATQESRSAGLWWVISVCTQKSNSIYHKYSHSVILYDPCFCSFSASFYCRWPHQCNGDSKRPDHPVLRRLWYPQTHCQLEEKRSSHQYWPEPEYVQVDPGFLPLCFLIQDLKSSSQCFIERKQISKFRNLLWY